MGCGSSTAAAAPPAAAHGGQPQLQREPGGTTPTALGTDSTQCKPTPGGNTDSTVPPDSGSSISVDDVCRGGLIVLSQLSAWSGMGSELVTALTGLYHLWNSAHTRPVWCGEFMAYLRGVEGDLSRARTILADRPHHVHRIAAEITAARVTLEAVLSPSTSFVVDIVRVPFLQERLLAHRAAIGAAREEALAGTVLDAALDLRQTRAMVHDIIQGGDAARVSDPRDALRAVQADGPQITSEAQARDSVLSSSKVSASTPELGQLFSVFGTIYDAYNRLESALATRRARAAKRAAGEEEDELSKEDDEEESRPPAWLNEFIAYLHQTQGEVRHAHLLLAGSSSRDSPLAGHVRAVSSAVSRAGSVVRGVSDRFTPSSSTFSRFLRLLHSSSDRANLRDTRGAIESAKAAMMVSALTALKVESATMASIELRLLQEHLASTEAQLKDARIAARERRANEAMRAALAPVECDVELAFEHARFLHGTRRTVLEHFDRFVARAPDAETTSNADSATDTIETDPVSLAAVFLVLSSPGHGKTTLSSYLAQTRASQVVAAAFFKFDETRRRSSVRAIRSLVWQAAERIDGLKPFVREALRQCGVEVEEEEVVDSNGPSSRSKNSLPTPGALDALTVRDLWDQLLAQPLWRLDRERKEKGDSASRASRVVLLLDALDESESGGRNDLTRLLAHVSTGGRHALPAWVGIVLTTRPDGHVTRTLATHCHAPTLVNLDELDDDQAFRVKQTKTNAQMSKTEDQAPVADGAAVSAPRVSDLRFFLTAVVSTFMPAAPGASTQSVSASRAQCVDLLLRKSEGMFLYARLVFERRGLDLKWVSRAGRAEVQEALEKGRPLPHGFETLSREDLVAFPAGLNNLYLEIMQRATETGEEGTNAAAAGRGAAGGADARARSQRELRRILSCVAVAREPLTLLQTQQALRYTAWGEVIRRTASLRSVLHVKSISSVAGAEVDSPPAADSVLRLSHKSIRDWLVAAERLEDSEEAPFHIDERRATSDLLVRGWEELQSQNHPIHTKSNIDSTLANPRTTLPPSTSFTLASVQICPILRVEEVCLPSRAAPNHAASLLAYAIRHLPSHALSLCAPTSIMVNAPDTQQDQHLQILVGLLCHLQYVHMRTSRSAWSAATEAATTSDPSRPDSASAVNPDELQLAKEYDMAIFAVQRLLARRVEADCKNGVVTSEESAVGLVATDESASTLRTLRRCLRLLRAFSRFFRSESPRFAAAMVDQCVATPRTIYCATLWKPYEYAASYPPTHPVAKQARQLQTWLQTWRHQAQAEATRVILDATRDEAPHADGVALSSPWPLAAPLVSGWTRWLDKPSCLSRCVAVVPHVGSVSSLACARVPRSGAAQAASSGGLREPPSVLFAVAHAHGTFTIFDLATRRPLWRDYTGTTIAFDLRVTIDGERSAGGVVGFDPNDPDDDREPPFFAVAGSANQWSTLDLSADNAGETRSQNLHWNVPKSQAQARGGPPPRRSSGQLKWMFAPLADRALAVQYGTNDLACETLLCNRGLIHPFPASAVGSSGAPVVCVAFTHAGDEVLLAQEHDTRISIFACDEANAGREPLLKQHIYADGANVHASCLAFSKNDDFLARGGIDGSVGMWTRERRRITAGAWVGEESSWTYVSMNKPPAAHWTGIGCICVSDDGSRILAGTGADVLVFQAASRRCILVLDGHVDRVAAVAFTPDAAHALTGGAGVDQTVRIWELPDADEAHGGDEATSVVPEKDQPQQDGTQLGVAPTEVQGESSLENSDPSSSVLSQPSLTTSKRSVRVLAFLAANGDHQEETLIWNGNEGLHALPVDESQSVARDEDAPLSDRPSATTSSPDSLAEETKLDTAAPSSMRTLSIRPATLLRVIAVSPVGGGDVIICGSHVDDLEVWSRSRGSLSHALRRHASDDLGTSGVRAATSDAHSSEAYGIGAITALRFTACGRFVIGVGFHSHVYVWRVDDGEPVLCIDTQHTPLLDGRESSGITVTHAMDLMMHDEVRSKVGDGTATNESTSNPRDETSYLLSVGAPTGTLQTFMLRVRNEMQHVAPVVSERLWSAQLSGVSSSAIVRSVLFHRSHSRTPLLFTADSAATVHIFSANDGAILHAFSTAAPNTPPRDLDPIMRIAIIESKSEAALISSEPADASADAVERTEDGIIQLVVGHSYSGVSVWCIDGVLARLVSSTLSREPVNPSSFTTRLDPPPPLLALLRLTRSPLTQLAVSSSGRHFALGCDDGSLVVARWRSNPDMDARSASAPSSDVALWRGLFDFHPAQRTELTELVAQVECYAPLQEAKEP